MTHRLRIVYAGTPGLRRAGARGAARRRPRDRRRCTRSRTGRPAAARRSARARSSGCAQALGLRGRAAGDAALRPKPSRACASSAPDLMVVVAYGLILPPAVLEVPRLGCLNIHASLLPRWRGAAPIQRAILAGDAETGITIMQMDAGLDTGPMLLHAPGADRRARRRRARCTTGWRRSAPRRSSRRSREWQAGRLAPVPQPADGVTYARKIRKEEARIDWTGPADAIDRQVRAFNPWPVAETRWQDRQLRVWAAEPLPAAEPAEPGQVVEAGGAADRRRGGRGRAAAHARAARRAACRDGRGIPERTSRWPGLGSGDGLRAPSPAQIRAAAAELVAGVWPPTAARSTSCSPGTPTRARRAGSSARSPTARCAGTSAWSTILRGLADRPPEQLPPRLRALLEVGPLPAACRARRRRTRRSPRPSMRRASSASPARRGS